MPRRKLTSSISFTDQQPLYITRRSFAGGQNTRINAGSIPEDELTVAYNVDLSVPGQLDKRPGATVIANDSGGRTVAMESFYPTGGTPALYLVETTNVKKWTGSGSWSSALYSSLTTGLDTQIARGGESGENEVLLLQNGTDNPLRINSGDTFQDLGSGATSPPKSVFHVFINNRWWILKDGFLYYSSAFPTDYSTAFDGANGFRFSGYGDSKGLYAVRTDSTSSAISIVAFMQNAIVGVTPSATPAATDLPYIITNQHGAIERKCITQVGDDIFYLASDGIRSLRRTTLDHLQIGTSYPMSYRLRDEFEMINWAQSSKFHMTFWRDKLFFFFVAEGSSEVNRCWIYWPALDNGVGKGWAVATGTFATMTATAKFFVSGEEQLYGGSSNGTTYQLWDGQDDADGAISLQVETRDEDLGQPAVYKSGGEVEVIAEAVGDYDLTVSAAIDGGGYQSLGTMNLASGSPTLPLALPFALASSTRVSQKFHLDALGRYRRIRFKIENADVNGSDIIRIYEINVTGYAEAYESE